MTLQVTVYYAETVELGLGGEWGLVRTSTY